MSGRRGMRGVVDRWGKKGMVGTMCRRGARGTEHRRLRSGRELMNTLPISSSVGCGTRDRKCWRGTW